jgi:hypothetical protein
MAGSHPFLRKIRQVVKSLDDDTLAALANRGLLRRAQKDLETSPPAMLAVEDACVRLQVGEAAVEVPELPSKCRCDCPATGVCRHILAALLFLRDSPELAAADTPAQSEFFDGGAADAPAATAGAAESPAAASTAEILANLGDEELQKWAGKATFRKALKSLAANPQVEIESAASFIVRFPARNVACRWIPGGGPLGVLCSCQADPLCEHAVAAILAYQISLGKRQIGLEEAAPRQAAGAPRTRAEVLDSAAAVLGEIVALGLARLSPVAADRLTTLAVSAHGVDLPRLERMLKSLADDVKLALRRDAQFNPADFLAQAARLEALRTALARSAAPALVGQHRSQYHEVGQIALVGLGAQQWRSKGGYHGLTLFFWDESRKAWATWSDSRPADQADFDPVKRFRADGPWAGCNSPKQAAMSALRLTGAWRNPAGRLSGRAATRAIVVGPSSPRDVPEQVAQWSLLADRARRLFGGGLSERTENMDLVLLTPKLWGPAAYDPLRQELLRPLLDEAGRAVNLWLPFTPENEKAVELLERHDPADTFGLLGAIRLVAGQLRVQPISLFAGEKIIHLTLADGAAAGKKSPKDPSVSPRQKGRPSGEPAEDEELASEEYEEAALSQAAAATPLGRLITTAQAELEAIVESGIAVRRGGEMLQSAAKRLENLGLTVCSRALAAFFDAYSRSAHSPESEIRREAAAKLLRAYYLLRLAADQETINAACAGLG